MQASSKLSNNFTFSFLLHKKKKQNSNFARSLSGKDLQNQYTRLLEEAMPTFWPPYWINHISISPHTEWNMTAATDPSPTLNQMEVYLVKNRKENCHHHHIPLHVKGNRNIVPSAYKKPMPTFCRKLQVASLYNYALSFFEKDLQNLKQKTSKES